MYVLIYELTILASKTIVNYIIVQVAYIENFMRYCFESYLPKSYPSTLVTFVMLISHTQPTVPYISIDRFLFYVAK